MTSLARANEMIRRLAPWECCFALDDSGTGANCLTYLNSLPCARVKIHGCVVRDILTNPRSEATVRGIVERVRALRIETGAESLATEAIAAKLRNLGVDCAPGYAFARAELLDAILKSLAQDESERMHRRYLQT